MIVDLQNVFFKMPIDDVFELDENDTGVLVTGHIESGTIRPNSSVIIVDSHSWDSYPAPWGVSVT